MVGSKDNSDVSLSNNIEPTMETLSAEDHQEFEEHKEKLIKEAQAKFLANFKGGPKLQCRPTTDG
jgi:hypothetical protein